MYIRRKNLMIKYWLKIISSNNSSIIKLTYNMLRNDANNNNYYNNLNWASHIKQILNEIGMSHVWNNQYNLSTSNLSAIKQRIIDIYQQTWHNSINQSQRLDSYKQYKNNISMENYLNHLTINTFRISLTRF